jgi:hypothetical protein
VETARQRDVLSTVGVALGQGWLWGRAVPPAQFAARWSAAALDTSAPPGAGRPGGLDVDRMAPGAPLVAGNG